MSVRKNAATRVVFYINSVWSVSIKQNLRQKGPDKKSITKKIEVRKIKNKKNYSKGLLQNSYLATADSGTCLSLDLRLFMNRLLCYESNQNL